MVTSIDDLAELQAIHDLIRSGGARALRVRAGRSLGELGRSIGTDASQISRWETGRTMPRPANAKRYAAALRVLGWERLP